METKHISDMTLTGGGKAFKILQCQVVRQVNAIPQASVTIATGFNITSGRSITFQLNKAQMRSEWVLQISGSVNCEIFRGYIMSVGKSTQLSPGGSTVMTTLKLVGSGQRLANMVTGAYRYWGPTTINANQMTPSDKNMMFLTLGVMADTIHENLKLTDMTANVGGFLVATLAEIQKMYTQQADAATQVSNEFDSGIKVGFAPDQLKGALEPSATLITMLANAWKSSSVWNALLSMCRQQMFLNIVPVNHKLAIIPAFPWQKNAAKSVDASELLGASDESTTGALQEDIEAAFVEYNTEGTNGPGMDTTYATYPKIIEKKDYPTGTARTISLPGWMNNYSALEATYAVKDEKAGKRTAADTAKIADAKAADKKNVPSMAEVLAKVFFAEAKNRQVVTNLRIPWYRFDFMNMLGYVIKVTNLQTGGSENKETVYGMLASMVFYAKSSGSGSTAGMTLTLQHIRDENLNTEFGFDENPLYTVSGTIAGVPQGGAGSTTGTAPGDAASAAAITGSVSIGKYGAVADGKTSIATLTGSGAVNGSKATGISSIGGVNSATMANNRGIGTLTA